MASGKSTVGPELAAALDAPFIDLDHEIEEDTGCSIPELFSRGGEALFRERERAVLREVSDGEDAVISVGGGTLADAENLSLAKKSGTVVYLMADVDELVRRLLRGAPNRPMLHDDAGNPLPRNALRARIKGLLEARAPFYDQADIRIDAAGKSVSEIVAQILERIDVDQA